MSDFNDLLEIGEFYILSQKFDEAIRTLKRAEKIKKDDARLYFNMGMAYEGLSSHEQARNAYRAALEINKEYKEAREHLDRLIEQ
ncbi:hypothetical protein A2Y85_06465 [candidate division WOR-3 bacterium RBG_13_43_14]|uniref:Uncharacterized protein n=1 Tax=candidate division WOR-3 bacterium RBG_13_43_14 TaxID=1802590 RepID=A0A1F4UAJ5_UNCW3|nr:MAG: hypothetical protein A2Y85_06465 [candidate division WOR-3 bacterium RBG_13_43_14]